MGAQYQLDQKTIWWSALGLSVAGCLVFVAGMVVGISLGGRSLLAEGGVPPEALAKAPVPVAPPVELEVAAAPPQAPLPVEQAALIQVPVQDDLGVQAQPSPEPEPEPEPEQKAVVADDPVLSPYSLQVGAYLMQDNLDRALAELEKKGLQARVVEVTDSRGTILSSVRVGEYDDRAEAESAAALLRRKNGLEVLVKRDLQRG